MSTLRRQLFKTPFHFLVRPNVNTNPSWKQNFSKTLFRLNEFEDACFAFYFGKEDIFDKEPFQNDDLTMITWFPCDCCVLKVSLGSGVDGRKHLLCFKSDISVFKPFLRRSRDGTKLIQFWTQITYYQVNDKTSKLQFSSFKLISDHSIFFVSLHLLLFPLPFVLCLFNSHFI